MTSLSPSSKSKPQILKSPKWKGEFGLWAVIKISLANNTPSTP